MHPTDLDRLINPAALAERWGVTVGHLANLRYEHRGPAYVKIGSRVAYRIEDIAAFEAQGRVETEDSIRIAAVAVA